MTPDVAAVVITAIVLPYADKWITLYAAAAKDKRAKAAAKEAGK